MNSEKFNNDFVISESGERGPEISLQDVSNALIKQEDADFSKLDELDFEMNKLDKDLSLLDIDLETLGGNFDIKQLRTIVEEQAESSDNE